MRNLLHGGVSCLRTVATNFPFIKGEYTCTICCMEEKYMSTYGNNKFPLRKGGLKGVVKSSVTFLKTLYLHTTYSVIII